MSLTGRGGADPAHPADCGRTIRTGENVNEDDAHPAGLLQIRGPTEEAFTAWLDFPVGAAPRPIILIGAVPTLEGFTTDEAKIAAMQGTYELGAALPETVPETVEVVLPDGGATLPVIDAAAAWEAVRAAPNTTPVDPSVPPLRVTEVELGTALFWTDRGKLALPAWNLTVVDGLGPISWPALRPELFWQLGAIPYPYGGYGGTVSADGLTLNLEMAGQPRAYPGERVIRFEAAVLEDETAVAVGPRAVDTGRVEPGPYQPNRPRMLGLRIERYAVSLARPLGARVVVDPAGTPVPVTRQAP
jgi:hypothetical protein